MDSIPRQLLLQVVLILINAFFAATEIAVISLNGTKLEKKDRRRRSYGGKAAETGGRAIRFFVNDSDWHHIGRLFRQCVCCRKLFRSACRLAVE